MTVWPGVALRDRFDGIMDNSGAYLPARPRLSIRVGVTGHRNDRLANADAVTLQERIRTVLGVVRETAHHIRATAAAEYASVEPSLTLVSSLASGSDCAVAAEAKKLGYELQVPLPFERNEYRGDFETPSLREEFDGLLAHATAVLELDGSRADAPAAYARASEVMLEHSDFLIAIWDGVASPLVGGTAHTVREAQARSIPVCWINVASPHAMRMLAASVPTKRSDDIQGAVAEVLAGEFGAITASDDAVRESYFVEAPPSDQGPGVFRRFRSFLEFGSDELPSTHGAATSKPTVETADLLASASPALRAEQRRADELALHYAARYRDAFVANYLMGALAVAMALVGFRSPAGTITELLLIAGILVVTHRGRQGKWHERWLGYRLCAEQLRHLALLRPLGRALPSYSGVRGDDAARSSHLWPLWLARARSRELGMSAGVLDTARVAAYRDGIEYEIREQVSYHEKAAHRNFHLAHRLHTLGTRLFYITAVVCVIHLGYELWHYAHAAHSEVVSPTGARVNMSLTMLAAVLPAFGAAFAGIASQAEFERVGLRSQAVSRQLAALLPPLAETHHPSGVYSDVAVAAVETMTAELLDWQMTFRSKPISLPA